MPVSTQLIENGVPRKIAWSWWYTDRLLEAMELEATITKGSPLGDDDIVNVFPSSYVFKQDHTFTEREDYIWANGNPLVDHTFTVQKGSEYRCWR